MLPGVIRDVTKVWLDSAVPASLQEMDTFQIVIAAAKDFCSALKALGFSNLGDLQDWTENAPRVWLSKCREAALDSVRVKLSQGIGTSRQVERVEKQIISKSQGEQLAANGATTDADDQGWGAWDDGEENANEQAVGNTQQAPGDGDGGAEGEDDGTDAWGWGDDDAEQGENAGGPEQPKTTVEEDDPTEAWGWGDEANEVEDATLETKPATAPVAKAKPPTSSTEAQSREVTFKEIYNISSMPQPVLDLIHSLAEDGAALTQDTYANSPVAAAAAGLFSLPTLVLAMFRAVSPYYYASDSGGNMYGNRSQKSSKTNSPTGTCTMTPSTFQKGWQTSQRLGRREKTSARGPKTCFGSMATLHHCKSLQTGPTVKR